MNRRKEINKIVKDSIAESLFFLMRTKTFSDITVTEIVKKPVWQGLRFIAISHIKKT